MDITLEMVDQVRERTGATYEEAKTALEGANGNVVDAIIAIERENTKTIDVNEKIDNVVEKIKGAVQKGNVNRIRMLRGGEELANIPVNAGIAGGVLGLMAPGLLIPAVIAGAVAKFGFDCHFEIVKEDGSIEEIPGEEDKNE
jgi:predicted RNase H-like HicB family nuclease